MSLKILRFPIEDSNTDLPWITFHSFNADYSFTGDITIDPESSEHIALYMPTGYTVNDSLSYTDASGGLVGSLSKVFTETLESGGDFFENITNVTSSSTEIAKALGAELGRSIAQGAADFLTPGSDVVSLVNRQRGLVRNPNQFSIFESPNLRDFSFTFKLIPQSEKEADVIPQIIKSFRLAAYPDVPDNKMYFTFPKIFKIIIVNSQQTIKIPWVACQSISVNYNPTSMSFFKYNNMPSEIDLTLSFKELSQLTKEQIDKGY